jgi:general secretion pathway protein G
MMNNNSMIVKVMKKKASGMSMIEIMLVFAVALTVLVGVFQIYRSVQSSQRKSATQSLLTQVQAGIQMFKNDLGRYPASLEEFVNGPSNPEEKRRWSEDYIDKKIFVDGTVKDAWGNELAYNFDKAKNKIEVFSWGEKGVGSESGQIFAD